MVTWFAVEKGKYGIAIDILEKYARKSDLNLNILCYAKAKSGDVEGTINELLRSVKGADEKWKIEITSEVMDVITEGVKYLDSPIVNEKFSILCTLLDKHAVLMEKSIKENVLMPIEKNIKWIEKQKKVFSSYKNSQTSLNKDNGLA